MYILENVDAKRVKIGVTINAAVDRLRDVNDMWLGRKGTCQVCGNRLVMIRGRVPQPVAGIPRHFIGIGGCPGTHEQALEQSTTVAHQHLEALRARQSCLVRVRKHSARRMIATLERRISGSRHGDECVGLWRLHTVFRTERAETVELISHALLSNLLDTAAPIGEIFQCSVPEAEMAVELALTELCLDQTARMEILV
ncbi:MAG: hypothetical protein V4813_13150 [Gemmatimonadota bacterium]